MRGILLPYERAGGLEGVQAAVNRTPAIGGRYIFFRYGGISVQVLGGNRQFKFSVFTCGRSWWLYLEYALRNGAHFSRITVFRRALSPASTALTSCGVRVHAWRV